MKKLLTITLLTAYQMGGGIFAQNNGNNGNNGQGVSQWKTNGNIADSAHYIGTKMKFH